MFIRADSHLFGSKQGYQSLAKAAGVAQSESDELSTFGFGQTGSSAFLDSLAIEPSAYGRQLCSGRIGITRCLKGNPDDAGRPTLLLCTLLFAPKEYESLIKSGLDSLLRDPSNWELALFESGEQIQIQSKITSPFRAVQDEDLRVLDAWLTSQLIKGSVSAFTHECEIAKTVLALPQVLIANDRLRYRWGVNLLSGDVAVDVCTLSTFAKQSGRRKINRFESNGSIRNDIIGFLRNSLDAGTLKELPSLSSILNPVPESSTLPDKPRTLAKEAEFQIPIQSSHKRRVLTAAAISFAGVALVASVLALGAGIFSKYQNARESQAAQLENANHNIRKKQIKPQKSVTPDNNEENDSTTDTSKPPTKTEGKTDKEKTETSGDNENSEQSKETSKAAIGPKDKADTDTDPVKDDSETDEKTGDESGKKGDEGKQEDAKTPNEFQSKDNEDSQQDRKLEGKVDEELKKQKEDKEVDAPNSIDPEPDPIFTDLSERKINKWFDDHSLTVNKKNEEPLVFNDTYGKDYLKPYVERVEKLLSRIAQLKQLIDRIKALNKDENVSNDDINRKTMLINSLDEPVKELSSVLGKYIEYLLRSYEEDVKASSRENVKDWRDLDWLKQRINASKQLLQDALTSKRAERSVAGYVQYITDTDKSRARELREKLKSWKKKIGGKQPNPYGLIKKLIINEENLAKRIKSLEIEKGQLKIKKGSDNGKSDN